MKERCTGSRVEQETLEQQEQLTQLAATDRSSLGDIGDSSVTLTVSRSVTPLSFIRRDDFSVRVGVGGVVACVRLISDHHFSHVSVAARQTRQSDARVVVRVDRLAEVDRVLELLSENFAARVAWHLEQEEARVALWQELVGWNVLVQHLHQQPASQPVTAWTSHASHRDTFTPAN